MSDFVLNPTVLQVIRRLAGRVDRVLIARAVGCTVPKLEQLCRLHCVSLKVDAEELSGVGARR